MKYNLCKECGKILLKKGNTFCNSSCAGKYNNRNRDISYITEEFRNKAREKAIKHEYDVEKLCKVCNNPLSREQKKRERTYCSNECRAKDQSEETKEKIRKTKLDAVKNKTHKGWKSRKIISYPERFFIEVLKNNNLDYELNYVIKKIDLGLDDISNYFLDFYFENKRIDLEIDGKQHNYKDRKESDKIRDSLLEKIGIKVYRIKWKNPNSDKNKEYLKMEIDKFFSYYNEN